jgi:hypothetical protein
MCKVWANLKAIEGGLTPDEQLELRDCEVLLKHAGCLPKDYVITKKPDLAAFDFDLPPGTAWDDFVVSDEAEADIVAMVRKARIAHKRRRDCSDRIRQRQVERIVIPYGEIALLAASGGAYSKLREAIFEARPKSAQDVRAIVEFLEFDPDLWDDDREARIETLQRMALPDRKPDLAGSTDEAWGHA